MKGSRSGDKGLRLNRFLAAAGLGSRRSCEEHILKGRVTINGSVRKELATRVLPEDDIRVNGRVIHAIAPRTILLNKPAGYTTTRSDRHAERTIFELLPSDTGHLFHVGRLDKESEGLLLLTNDGMLAQELMHPSKGIEKEYEVILDKTFTSRDATLLKKGTRIEGALARVEAIRQLAPNKIQIILHQGLKRQIRIMLGQLDYKVKRLNRTRIGPLTLRGVKPGSYRDLRKEDLEMLRKALSTPKLNRETRGKSPGDKGPKGSLSSPLTDADIFSDNPIAAPKRAALRKESERKRKLMPKRKFPSDIRRAKPARKTSPTRDRKTQ
jgi:23S rRNA pseudouridine2605 synthase